MRRLIIAAFTLLVSCAAPPPQAQTPQQRSAPTASDAHPAVAAPAPALDGSGCPALDPALPEPPSTDDACVEPSEANLRSWIDYLADPRLRGRRAGSADTHHLAAVLSARLTAMGFTPVLPGGGLCQHFPTQGAVDNNVVALLGRGEPASRLGVLLAHYDHLGIDAAGNVYRGADDNASGVSAVLEAARLLSRQRGTLRRDLVVVLTSSEEQGTVGAAWFVGHAPFDLSRIDFVVNVDEVGRQLMEGHPMRRMFSSFRDAIGVVASGRGRGELLLRLEQARQDTGVRLIGIPEEVLVMSGYSSDSVPFSPHAPTLFLSTSVHADYHRPTDTPERVDIGQVTRATRVVVSLMTAAAPAAK